MRAVLALLVLALLAAPLAGATPVAGSDCGERDPVAEGCGAYAYVFEEAGSGGCAASSGHSQGGTTGPALGCFAGTKDAFVAAGCWESRWAQDPYSEDVQRACYAGAGDASGQATFVSCSTREHRSPSGNVTWIDCFPTGLQAGAEHAERNRTFTAIATFSDGSTGRVAVTCPAAPEDAPQGCAVTISTSHVESACRTSNHTRFDPLFVDLAGDARCAASADADGDGAPEASAACGGTMPEPRWPFETAGGCGTVARAVVLNAGYYCERQLPSAGGPGTTSCGGEAAASRNQSYPFDPDVRDGVALRCDSGDAAAPRPTCAAGLGTGDLDGDGRSDASTACSLNLTASGSDPNAGCGDELAADLDGDGAPDAACRSEGNVTKKQKQWLPANFRCSAGADADGDGEADHVGECGSDGIAIDHEGVQSTGSEGACSARNGTRPAFFDITYRIGNGTLTGDPDFDMLATVDADSDGASDVNAGCGDAIAMGGATSTGCRFATKWKVYSPLPGSFREAAAECGIAIDEPGVLCTGGDLDGDGVPDVRLAERDGRAIVTAHGCTVVAPAGGLPATRGCLA